MLLPLLCAGMLFVSGLVSCLYADAPTDAVPPPLTLESGSDMLVDNYEHGLFVGSFKDKLGSTIDLEIRSHANPERGHYLYVEYNLLPAGFVGFWSRVGADWNEQQDWKEARSFHFLVWADRITSIQFTFKGLSGKEYKTSVQTTRPGAWEKISVPISSLTNVAAGLDVISGFDLLITSSGKGCVALDDLQIEDGKVVGNSPQIRDLSPLTIYKKTLVPPSERSSKIYYVEKAKGNDSFPGTEEKPWSTIQRAADTMLPGDTVIVKKGLYEEHAVPYQAGVSITKSGAPQAYITFKAYPGQRPRVTSGTWGTFRLDQAAYIKIEGFDVTTTLNDQEKKNVGCGIVAQEGHHIEIRNNTVHDCGGGGIGAVNSDYLTIEDNIAYGNAFYSIYNCSGISLFEIVDFDHRVGLHNIIRRNVSYRNENKGPTPLYGGKLTDGNGIIIDFHFGKGQVLIENNICYDNGGRGIHVFHANNVVVRNNTLVGNERTSGKDGADLRAYYCSDIHYINNIVVGRDGQSFMKSYESIDITSQNNLFYNYTMVDPDFAHGSEFGKAPHFLNGNITSVKPDFHLKKDSPGVDEGSTILGAREDFSRKPRPQGKATDIGAYER